MNKIYSLQVFRGLAAVMVLLAHANIMLNRELFSGAIIIGYVGVDFFFVLSGFIIMLTSRKDIGTGKVMPYIRKRLTRVYPPYILYTIITIAISYAYFIYTGAGIVTWIDINVLNVIKSISLYPISQDITPPPIIPVAWTLSYEMLFYAVFASAFFIKGRGYVFFVAILWLSIISISKILSLSFENNILSMLLSLRNIEFIMGCALAYFVGVVVNWKVSALTLMIGLILLVISWHNTLNGFSVTTLGNWAAFGVPFAMIIFGATRLESLVHNKEGKIFRFLVYLGDASYSIYLVHFIVIMICKRAILDRGMTIGYIEFWATSSIALIVSIAMYSLIEKPIMRLFNRSKVSAVATA